MKSFGEMEDGAPSRIRGHDHQHTVVCEHAGHRLHAHIEVRYVLGDVGGNDEVEPFVDRAVHQIVDQEPEVGVLAGCDLDHRGADVDADAVGRIERCQDVAGGAAHLKHMVPRGNDLGQARLQGRVVVTSLLLPAVVSGRHAVEVFPHRA